MIPHFPNRELVLPLLPPASETEVFISRETMSDALENQHVPAMAIAGLWSSLIRNRGVHLDQHGQVDSVHRGGRYTVRTLGDYSLISVDGLVSGLSTGELFHAQKISGQRLGEIAYLGMRFTPDRADEIERAIVNLPYQIRRSKAQRRLDYLMSEKGC